MTADDSSIQAVPTNIITGFLGVGKTSSILHLLKSKPEEERWAVLVNEFGEIGVDGSLFEGNHSESEGVFIREVPGGCMCCAAGLPMQIALNQLLAKARPDRLLIEPTGLGHPQEILDTLLSEYYQEILNLQKTITLVDARQLKDSRYTHHDTFNQQISIADIVIGNKTDLYEQEDRDELVHYVKKINRKSTDIIFTSQGQFDIQLLQGAASNQTISTSGMYNGQPISFLPTGSIPKIGFIKAENSGEGFQSIGWRFKSDRVFDYNKLVSLLLGLSVDRIKAIMITDRGPISINMASDAMTESSVPMPDESCIEMIAESFDTRLEANILDCLVHDNRPID